MMATKNSYWAKRRLQERKWQEQQLKADKTFAKQIERHYNQVARDISDEIERQISRLAASNHSTYAEAQKAVTAEDVERGSELAKQVVTEAERMRMAGKKPTYSDWSAEVNQRMRVYNATMRINRLEYLKSMVGLQLTANGLGLANDISIKLDKAYRDECKRQAGIMGMAMANADAWINNHVIETVMASVNGGNWSERLWRNQDVLKARLDEVITTGLISGDNPREMARKLRANVKDTVKSQRYVTERLARTETARVQTQAQMQMIKGNGFEYVEWFAEPNACAICTAIANKDNGEGPGIYKLSEVPNLPQHPNCRCSIGSYYSDEMLDKKLKKLGFDA